MIILDIINKILSDHLLLCGRVMLIKHLLLLPLPLLLLVLPPLLLSDLLILEGILLGLVVLVVVMVEGGVTCKVGREVIVQEV